jgi:hypothetical protein
MQTTKNCKPHSIISSRDSDSTDMSSRDRARERDSGGASWRSSTSSTHDRYDETPRGDMSLAARLQAQIAMKTWLSQPSSGYHPRAGGGDAGREYEKGGGGDRRSSSYRQEPAMEERSNAGVDRRRSSARRSRSRSRSRCVYAPPTVCVFVVCCECVCVCVCVFCLFVYL